MGNTAPTVIQNDFPASVDLNTPNDWVVRGQDADARSITMSRLISDTSGNTTTVVKTSVVSDVLTYGPPTCDDPDVVLVVDPEDPAIVHVTAS